MLVGTLNFKKKRWRGDLGVEFKKKKTKVENGPTEEDFVIILLNK